MRHKLPLNSSFSSEEQPSSSPPLLTAAAIETEGKTLEGALKAAKEAARGKASGGVAMGPDTEVYATVLKYYGLAGEKQKTADVCGFGLDLDDILEG